MVKSYEFKLEVKVSSECGFLVPLEHRYNIPIEVNCISYIYNIPKNGERGSHAYKNTK